MAGEADITTVVIRFSGHGLDPDRITVPANTPLVLKVVNDSKDPVEFESFKLNREREIGPGGTVLMRLPALRPGTYDFYDDFHRSLPEGVIVAR